MESEVAFVELLSLREVIAFGMIIGDMIAVPAFDCDFTSASKGDGNLPQRLLLGSQKSDIP